jgi:hypothetical protein
MGNSLNNRNNIIREAARARILAVRFDSEGRIVNRPVRAVSKVKPARRHTSRSAADAVHKLRSEAEAQIRTLKVLGFTSLIAAAAVAFLTLSVATGAAPKIQQGVAVLTQFVEGFLS